MAAGHALVVGGDGTVNEAVNGLGQTGFPEGVTLALLPAGTGNDLAATLKIPADPAQAAGVIRRNRVRALVAARLRSRAVSEKFFINVAVGGAGREFPRWPTTRSSRQGGGSSPT